MESKKYFVHLVYFTHESTGYEKEYFTEVYSNSKTLSLSEATDALLSHVTSKNNMVRSMKKGFRIKGLHTMIND